MVTVGVRVVRGSGRVLGQFRVDAGGGAVGKTVRPGSFVFVLFGLVGFGSGFRVVRNSLLFWLVPALAGRRPVV